MAINLYGAVGDYFNCVASFANVLQELRAFQLTLSVALTNTTNGVTAQLEDEPDIQAVNGAAWLPNLQAPEAAAQIMQQLMVLLTNRVVFDDSPRINQNLTQVNIVNSIQEIILQMKQQGQTIQECTVTGTAGAFIGTGNGVVNISVYRPSDGLIQQNTFAETIQFLCTQDSYVGGANAGNEGFTVTGEGNQPDPFAFDWPLGSNATLNLNAIDGYTDNGAGNILTGSGFNSSAWTGTPPTATLDNWTLVAGAYGTNLAEETGITYGSDACLSIIGDGTTNFNITQTFNLTAGTLGELAPLTQYSFCLFMRRDGVAAANGTLTADLIDGSGNVIQDAAGANNTGSINLTTLTTSFAAQKIVFRTPLIMPSTYKIRLRLTGTALTTGRIVYAAKGSLGVMQRFYRGGPAIAVHSGSVNFVSGDYSNTVTTNNRGGAADGVSTFQTFAARTLPMMESNLMFPYSAVPSIPDSAI